MSMWGGPYTATTATGGYQVGAVVASIRINAAQAIQELDKVRGRLGKLPSATGPAVSGLGDLNATMQSLFRQLLVVAGAIGFFSGAITGAAAGTVKLAMVIDNLNLSALSMAANLKTAAPAESFDRLLVLSRAMVAEIQNMDAAYVGTAKELTALVDQMIRGRMAQEAFTKMQTQAGREQIIAFASVIRTLTGAADEYQAIRQFMQEIRSLEMGRATTNDYLMRTLKAQFGITKDTVDQWIAQGAVMENVLKLFSGYGDALKSIQGLLQTQLSTLQTTKDKIIRQGLEPAYRIILDVVGKVGAALTYQTEEAAKLAGRVKGDLTPAGLAYADALGRAAKWVYSMASGLVAMIGTMGIVAKTASGIWGFLSRWSSAITIVVAGIVATRIGLAIIGPLLSGIITLQNLWNAAAAANPYTILITALQIIVGLISMILGMRFGAEMASQFETAARGANDLADALERVLKRLPYAAEYAMEIVESQAEINRLQVEYGRQAKAIAQEWGRRAGYEKGFYTDAKNEAKLLAEAQATLAEVMAGTRPEAGQLGRLAAFLKPMMDNLETLGKAMDAAAEKNARAQQEAAAANAKMEDMLKQPPPNFKPVVPPGEDERKGKRPPTELEIAQALRERLELAVELAKTDKERNDALQSYLRFLKVADAYWTDIFEAGTGPAEATAKSLVDVGRFVKTLRSEYEGLQLDLSDKGKEIWSDYIDDLEKGAKAWLSFSQEQWQFWLESGQRNMAEYLDWLRRNQALTAEGTTERLAWDREIFSVEQRIHQASLTAIEREIELTGEGYEKKLAWLDTEIERVQQKRGYENQLNDVLALQLQKRQTISEMIAKDVDLLDRYELPLEMQRDILTDLLWKYGHIRDTAEDLTQRLQRVNQALADQAFTIENIWRSSISAIENRVAEMLERALHGFRNLGEAVSSIFAEIGRTVLQMFSQRIVAAIGERFFGMENASKAYQAAAAASVAAAVGMQAAGATQGMAAAEMIIAATTMMAAATTYAAAASAGAAGNAVGGLLGPLLGIFQHGGIVTKPTLALVGEAGPELIVPLSRSHSPGFLGAATLGGAGAQMSLPGPVVQFMEGAIHLSVDSLTERDRHQLAGKLEKDIARVLQHGWHGVPA